MSKCFNQCQRRESDLMKNLSNIDFKTNVLDVLKNNPILKLPQIENDCNVVQYENFNGQIRLKFYKLENDNLYYYAWKRWNNLPDLEYTFKRENFYYCELI